MSSDPRHPVQPPFANFIGAELTVFEDDRIEARIRVEEHLLNRNGTMHGGAILAIADNLGGTAAFARVEPGLTTTTTTTTIESKTNFLRSIPLGDVVRFVCEPLHFGNRTSVFQTKIMRSDGKVAAIVTQTQLSISRD